MAVQDKGQVLHLQDVARMGGKREPGALVVCWCGVEKIAEPWLVGRPGSICEVCNERFWAAALADIPVPIGKEAG